MSRFRILHRALLAAACLACTAAFAQARDQKPINIPPGDLVGALDALAKQSGAEFIYRADQLTGLHTEGAQGNLSADEALSRLLRGSGFVIKHDASGAILIVKGDQPAKPSKPAKRDDASARSNEEAPAELEKVTVTGSRLPQVSIQGPQEVKLYTRANITESGQKTVMDFLNTLPTVSTVVSEAGFDTVGGAGAVRLRGLPIGSTLVLLDGRAVEGAGSGQSHGNPFDVNNIPISAVERIEVVPEAASAVYGSDAIGGVVNIILRKDLDGGEVNVTSGSPTDGVYRDTTVNAVWGKKFERGDLSFVGSYQVRGALLNTDRELTANQDYRRYGGLDERSTSCTPGNVYSADGKNLPGLSSSFAGIPYSTNGALTPSDFLSTSGVLNKCSSGSFGGTIVPSTHRASLMGYGNYAITETTQAFFQAAYTQIEQAPYLSPRSVSQIAVPATNPFNPFGVPVRVTYRFADEGRFGSAIGTEMFSRIVGGFKGTWGDRWDWEVAAWQSGDHMNSKDENTINTAALVGALANTDPTQSINLFSSGIPASQTILDKILYDAPVYSSSKLQVVNGFVRGSLFDLPAGPVNVVLGGEYDHTRQSLYAPGEGLPTVDTFSRSARSIFGEMHIPVLAAADGEVGEKLALTFAGRYDDYNDIGSRFTPQGGVEFRPTETLLLRATYAEAFKAPDLRAIYASPIVYSGIEVAPDPLRGGELYPTTLKYGGDLTLKPQTGNSRSIGFVWSSKAIENLQIGLTNFRVTQNDRIIQPNALTMIANPAAFPGRVVRQAPTADDVAKGYAGLITLIDSSYTNYGELIVEGFDLDVDYKFDTAIGTFSPALSVTEVYKYDAAVAPNAPLQDRLGYASADAFATRWKGTVSLAYNTGEWTARVAGRYISGYIDYDLVRHLGDYWLFDASLHYALGKRFFAEDSLMKNAYVEASVVNAFNKAPQFTDYYGTGYDPRMADIRGRFVSMTLGTRW